MLCGCLEVAGLFDLQLLNEQQSKLITEGCLQKSAFPQSGSLWQLAGGTETRVWPYSFLLHGHHWMKRRCLHAKQKYHHVCIWRRTQISHILRRCTTQEKDCVSSAAYCQCHLSPYLPAWSVCCFKGVVMLIN